MHQRKHFKVVTAPFSLDYLLKYCVFKTIVYLSISTSKRQSKQNFRRQGWKEFQEMLSELCSRKAKMVILAAGNSYILQPFPYHINK